MCSKRGIICRLCLIFGFLLFTSPTHAVTVSINEFLAHPGTGNPEWVEFSNASESAEYLKSYYLDDDGSFDSDSGSSAKKPLTSLNTTSPAFPFIILSSAIFNNDGDSVVLFDGTGAIIDQYTYYESPGSDISVGRYPDQTGGYALLSSSTQGQANGPPVSPPTPTPGPTATPTNTPTPMATTGPTPTKTPILTSIKTPTPTTGATPTISTLPGEQASPEGILGASDIADTPQASPAGRSHPLMPMVISFLFIGIGFALLSLVFFWQKRNTLKIS